MFLNHKIKYLILSLGIVLGSTNVYAAETRQLNSLQDVLVENKASGLHVRLAFQKPLSNQSPPVFYKKSARMDFTNAKFKSSSQYFPVKNSIIDQIYVSQFEANSLRMRFMLSKGDVLLNKKFKWEVKGRFLNINILKMPGSPLESSKVIAILKNSKKKKIEKPSISSTSIKENINGGDSLLKGLTNPSDEIKQSVNPKSPRVIFKSKDVLTPNEIAPINHRDKMPQESVSRNTKPVFADTLNLRSMSLNMVYMMLVVLGILFSVFYLFKKFVWRNSVFAGQDKPVNVLSTGYLGPKKSIALVEVAGEVLVLGIANDNISLLSNIRDHNKVEKIKNPKSPIKLSSIVIKKKKQSDSDEHSPVDKDKSNFDYSGKSSELEMESKYTRSDVALMIRKNLEKMGAAK